MENGLDIVIVLATLGVGMATAGALSAWADRRFPTVPLMVLGLSLGVFGWVHMRLPGGLSWSLIPEGFILVVARVVN